MNKKMQKGNGQKRKVQMGKAGKKEVQKPHKTLRQDTAVRRRRLRYGICTFGLVILVAAAFLVPQIIFAVQDELRVKNTVTEERGALDVAKLNLKYESNLRNRMSHFAQKKNYYVTVVENDKTDENELRLQLESLLDNYGLLTATDRFYGLFYDLIVSNGISASDVLKWEKYIIYGDDFKDGIALMVCFLDIDLMDGSRIRILVDTETNTFYYLSITVPNFVSEYRYSNNSAVMQNGSFTDSLWDGMETGKNAGYLDLFIFYANYYECDSFDETRGIDSDFADQITYEYINKNNSRASFLLNYGESDLNFMIHTIVSEDSRQISIGITQVGELIPGLAED